jgi:hypothetical protein
LRIFASVGVRFFYSLKSFKIAYISEGSRVRFASAWWQAAAVISCYLIVEKTRVNIASTNVILANPEA